MENVCLILQGLVMPKKASFIKNTEKTHSVYSSPFKKFAASVLVYGTFKMAHQVFRITTAWYSNFQESCDYEKHRYLLMISILADLQGWKTSFFKCYLVFLAKNFV